MRIITRAILKNAIRLEEESCRFYEEALKNATMHESFNLIKFLYSQELEHRMKLLDALNMKRIDGVGIGEEDEISTDTSPAEHSNGGFADICSEWPDPGTLTTRADILETALRKERCALSFYTKMRDRMRSKEIRDVFDRLANEESAHVRILLEELERAGD